MSTTCLYGDIVLPTATWYEKDDLNTSDMHPFIHPLSEAVQPLWESKSDWEIYKGIAGKFAEIGARRLGRGRIWSARRSCTTPPARLASHSNRRTGARRDRPDPRQDRTVHDGR